MVTSPSFAFLMKSGIASARSPIGDQVKVLAAMAALVGAE